MIIRLLTLLSVLLAVSPPAASQQAELVLTYVSRDGDRAYQRQRRYTGLVLRQKFALIDAVKAGIKESRILGRAIGVKFTLSQLVLGPDDPPADAVRRHIGETGSRILIMDVPLEDLTGISGKLATRDVILLNPRHRTMSLRRENCHSALFHTAASDAMLADGLAQYLRRRGWTRVLMLVGEQERDKISAAAFADAAIKFGLDITARRNFVPTNDPRQRDQNNIALLTQGTYDVVHISDHIGDFGRYVPFQTAQPRPVVGDHGLRSSGWHWTWERHGAPQLNQRFAREAKRDMTDTDWAAWAAVKSVVEAVTRTRQTDTRAIASYLRGDQFVLDGYKGTPGNFRIWNNQLRQPVLVHTHDAVIDRAPLEGFLHKTSTLDTLGDDEPNSACRF
ncbi:MAG: amino acid ABC transporter substrate-binding protein [Rhizobiales bacterium]|nr:amino acid ABC transporter substrate-binding protein [Hyphomicrobiales bacterium]